MFTRLSMVITQALELLVNFHITNGFIHNVLILAFVIFFAFSVFFSFFKLFYFFVGAFVNFPSLMDPGLVYFVADYVVSEASAFFSDKVRFNPLAYWLFSKRPWIPTVIAADHVNGYLTNSPRGIESATPQMGGERINSEASDTGLNASIEGVTALRREVREDVLAGQGESPTETANEPSPGAVDRACLTSEAVKEESLSNKSVKKP